ncbi:MAG: hypothetical protein QM737_23535 [Ferruginibacter sp.]
MTKRVILGKEKMKPEFVPLAEWINKTYGVKTINIIYDTIDKVQRPRLLICFEFEKEKQKFLDGGITYFNKNKQEAIGLYFEKMLLEQGIIKNKAFGDNFKPTDKEPYLTENIWVIFGAFEPLAKQEATYKITKERAEEFTNSFCNPDIWTISISFTIPTFFLFTDEKVKEYDKPEIKKQWADKFYDLIKPFDEFNYFKRESIQIYVDSKENFDNNYQSNWYYYYK